MKDIPYSTLKKYERAYKIMLGREQENKTFAEMAKEYQLSLVRVREMYITEKRRQRQLYLKHLENVLPKSEFEKAIKKYNKAYDFYYDNFYLSAYLEKEYKEILEEYRKGEPGIPEEYIKKLPTLRNEPDKGEISRIVKMREEKKAKFGEIGEKFGLTKKKAKRVYEMYYHEKMLKFIEKKQEKAKTLEERDKIEKQYPERGLSPKEKYEKFVKQIPRETRDK